MEKYTNEELLEVLPSSVKETKELTSKQKVVLGQLCVYNGLEIAKKDGYFYRSNKDLCDDCDIKSEHTLIAATRKLEMLGFIDRKKGSRGTGASEYRINEKLIGDYCKTNTANCSDNCSVKLAEMTNRIKELENTVKKLVEKIAVIEGRNYSTDKDIEIELDKEKDINNNILNKTSFKNILGESNQELETYESEETKLNQPQLEIVDSEENNLNESQLETIEIPSEVLVSTNELENTDELPTIDESYVPSDKEKEIWKGCLTIVNPYLVKMQSVTSRMVVDGIKEEIVCKVRNYFNSTDGVTDWVIMEFSKRVAEYTNARYSELEELHKEQIDKQLQQSNLYASYC